MNRVKTRWAGVVMVAWAWVATGCTNTDDGDGTSGGGSSSGSSSSGVGSSTGSSSAGMSSSGGGASSTAGTSTAAGSSSSSNGGSSGAGPSGETCETAIPVTPGSIPGTTVGANNDYAAAGLRCNQDVAGRDRVYAITIPSSTRLDVGILSGSFGEQYPFVLAIVDADHASCADGERSCVASTNGFARMAPPTVAVSHTNKTGADQRVYIIVDTAFADGASVYESTFTLTVDLVPVTVPPGDSCWNAQPITLPYTAASEDLAGYADDMVTRANNCAFRMTPERIHVLAVPARSVLTAHSTRGLQGLSLFEGPPDVCRQPVDLQCLAGAEPAAGGPAEVTLQWTNTSTEEAQVFLGADGAGPFDLDVRVETLATHDTCDTARVITCAFDGVASCTFADETAVGAVDNYQDQGTACGGQSTLSPDVAYRVDIPAMTLASFLVQTNQPGASPTLGMVRGPSPASCTGQACVGSGNGTSFMSYMNTTADTETLFLVVETGGATLFDVLVH